MGFKYVLVPASASDEMQELVFEGTAELQDDNFIKHLKRYFASLGQGVDRKILLKNMAEHAKKDVKALQDDLDPKVLDGICQMQSIDIFPVMVPKKDSGYFAVSLYCDDKGIAKNLPLNERAMSFIKSCGFNDQLYRGDIFFGRVYDNEEEEWKRIDFTMKDCSSDAEWVVLTRNQQKNRNPAQSMQDMQNVVQMKNDAAQIMPTKQEEATGETETYTWNDKGEEVEIKLKRPGVKKSDVKVTFQPTHLKVQIQSDVLLDVELFQKVICDECTWTIMDGGMEVTMVKQAEMVWSQLGA